MPDSQYPDEWRRLAAKDWRRVEMAPAAEGAGLAAFLLQQSLEKHLKAFVLAQGWTLRRSHELDALLHEATSVDASGAASLDLRERVSGCYLAERCPMTGWTGLSAEEVARDRAEASQLISAPFRDEFQPLGDLLRQQ